MAEEEYERNFRGAGNALYLDGGAKFYASFKIHQTVLQGHVGPHHNHHSNALISDKAGGKACPGRHQGARGQAPSNRSQNLKSQGRQEQTT